MKYILITLISSIISIGAFAQTTPRCSHTTPIYKTMTSDSMDVLHYSINLDIIYLSQKNISGYTDLLITPKIDGLTVIKLDLLKLSIDSVLINNQSIANWSYNDTLLDFFLANSIDIGDTIVCSIHYHGQPVKDPSGWGGFYFSNDSTFAFNMGVGMQDNPHNYGRVWYPCIDDFVDRATYDFNIRVKNGKYAVCNGTLEATNVGSNTTQYKWKLHNDIPTYLASVAVGPYVAVRDTFNGVNGAIPIAIYVKSSMVSQAQASFINLKQILTAFELYYGPYRWERVGYVGVPFSSGAMEHATSIAIGNGYINGTLTYESLFAHELSHHWFGDLVTCSSAPDMWLNEGWAAFSESMYQEMLYGKDAYKNNMRNLLFDVLKNTHHSDAGYWAVAGVPHNLTYGSTVYDKGATVAHSIRGYLGDNKFFSMLNAYMAQNAFSDQSSIDFRDFISANSGISMNDFFDSWVFEPGFSNFSIDSFYVGVGVNPPYTVSVAMQQRLKHKPNYANSNRVPITFMDSQWNRIDTVIEFSGQFGSQSFDLAFKPTAVFCDLDERLADATTDYSLSIKQVGSHNFEKSYFKMDVSQISDSALFQITHHWVGPDSLGINYPGLRISPNHFWTVEGIYPSAYDAIGSFRYFKASEIDADLIKNKNDSLILLYRPHGGMPWQRIASTKKGNWIVGYLEVNHLMNGQYVLAVYDYNYLGISDVKGGDEDLNLLISPNPSNGPIKFELNDDFPCYILIYDSVGKQVANVEMINIGSKLEGRWNPERHSAGRYFVGLYSKEGILMQQTSLIISK
ncbi:MAG: M1 family metallopeptidase [Bacteroidales bacterium]|nr:M1 family metallopeptidase [Bacteroidales bacterium]